MGQSIETMKQVLLILTVMLLMVIGCIYLLFNESERVVGKIPVENVKGLHFTIYQEQKFDYSTAVYYDIWKDEKKLISKKFFLLGTMDYEYASDFYANSYGSLIYLSYPRPNIVVAIHDLKSNRGYPRAEPNDSLGATLKRGRALLDRLKQHNPQLVGAGSFQP